MDEIPEVEELGWPVTEHGDVIRKVRQAIYETYRDRNPTLETAETGPRWSLEPDYRQDDFTAMAIAAVDALGLT